MTPLNMVPFEMKDSYQADAQLRRRHVQEILEAHNGGRYNDWPDMPIARLSVAALNGSNVPLIWYAGQHGITHGVHKWPAGMLENLPWMTVWFIPEAMGNTSVGGFSQNLLAIFVHEDKLWLVELGCDHEFVTVRHGNCYRERECTKCGYLFGEDSSG